MVPPVASLNARFGSVYDDGARYAIGVRADF